MIITRKIFWLGLPGVVVAIALFWFANQAKAAPTCETMAFEGSTFIACRYEPARHELRLFAADAKGAPLRSFLRLKAMLGDLRPRLAFAFNAGMYDERGRPIGLYVENSVEHQSISVADGEGNFHLKPNGVFWLDAAGAAHVTATDAYVDGETQPVWATQSGPMLVIKDALHPAIAADGASRYIRNGVGAACGKADGAIFVISKSRVSFGRLARLFRDGLHCRQALYLDGSVSSLWAPQMRRMDTDHALGPMVAVFVR